MKEEFSESLNEVIEGFTYSRAQDGWIVGLVKLGLSFYVLVVFVSTWTIIILPFQCCAKLNEALEKVFEKIDR